MIPKSPRRWFKLTPLMTVCIAGCTVGPDYNRPEVEVSEAWLATSVAGDINPAWWTRFGDSLLSEMVAAAITNNKDLEEADARLREARANRDAIVGRAMPAVQTSGSVTQNRLSENGLLPVGRVPGLSRDLSIFDVGFDASWEIDLWGSAYRSIESAEARAQAAEEERRGIVMQVVAEVVRSYVDLRSAQNLKASAIADAEAQEKIARLIEDRLRVGLASRSDLARAETQARATAALVPEFDSEAAAAAFRLALLLGRPPEALYHRLRAPAALPSAPVQVGAGMRSDLLLRRPDIRKAERDLAAATADVGVATADLFPRISLLGGLGLQSRNGADLISADSVRFRVGPSLYWPIFSGGRVRASIRAADARADAALARYERAVLVALADSETAINRYAAAGSARAEREAARLAAAESVNLARRRYGAGEDDLTALLQTQIAFSAADRLAIRARAGELQQLAALYKALGGGWERFE